MVRAIINPLLSVVLAMGLAATGASLSAQTDEAPKREPHPTMVLFLEEIEAGELEKAAWRIASVNDMFGRQVHYQYFTQTELTALLATCDLAVHTSRKLTLAIEKTEWELATPGNSMRAEMNFAGKGGSLNSVRVFRMTAHEAEALRRQAMELGAL